MRSPVIMKLEAKRLQKTYETVARGLEGQDYLLPGGFSAADISVGQAIYMGLHFAALDTLPTVARWYDRITAREAFQNSLPAEGAPLLYQKPFYPAWEVAT